MSHRPAPLVGRKGLISETRKGRCAAGQGMVNSERREKRRKKEGGNEKEKKEKKKERGGKEEPVESSSPLWWPAGNGWLGLATVSFLHSLS